MTLSELLRERRYVHQFSSEKLEEITDGEQRTFYWGVDPTADSMHVGNLMGILVLRRFLEHGHKLIVIVGGGTGMIGDPGGKSEERNLLSDETVKKNTEALRKQFSQLFDGMEFEMINNADWLHRANLMEFLRDVGKHFTVNEMIKRDSVRPRVETPDQSISFTEFSYMLLQAYDYLHLHENKDCTLQVGASDQWGNIISGVDLIRRKTGDASYAFCWPLLINKSTGKKFGKSEGGAVWLDPEKTSPFQFYQFWFNTEDDAVEEYLLKMTLISQKEISAITEHHKQNPSDRFGQKELAREVTKLVHGEKVARVMAAVSEVLFGDIANGEPLNEEAREALLKEAPNCKIDIGDDILDILVKSELASSKREARTFIEQGAISLNNIKITENRSIENQDIIQGFGILRRGKQRICLLTLA